MQSMIPAAVPSVISSTHQLGTDSVGEYGTGVVSGPLDIDNNNKEKDAEGNIVGLVDEA